MLMEVGSANFWIAGDMVANLDDNSGAEIPAEELKFALHC